MADGSSSTFRVLFKEPLEIQQGEYYVASAKLKVRIIFSNYSNEFIQNGFFSRVQIHFMVLMVYVG